MTPVAARRLARSADHDPGSRPHRLSASWHSGQRRARSGQPARGQCAGRQSSRALARSRSPTSARLSRSMPTMCGCRSSARKTAIEILPDKTASAGTLVDTMESVHLRARRRCPHRFARAMRPRCMWRSRAASTSRRCSAAFRPISAAVSAAGRAGRLLAGDLLAARPQNAASERDEFRLDRLDLSAPARFRVIAGPQSDYFSADAIARFFRWRIHRRSPAPTAWACGSTARKSITRAATTSPPTRSRPARSRCPGNGKPIVLLADRQTTGGYPKIATVISADLPALGRLPIGAQGRLSSR